MGKESEIQREVFIRYNAGNKRVFRNNVGRFRAESGNYIECGLRTGSADLIGWKTIEITQDMVGQKIAQFLSVEVKTPKGRLSKEQKIWFDMVTRSGGCAVIERE